MEVLLVWLVFAIICAIVASGQGRSGFLAFLAGLFFGVFALIYYLVVGDTIETKARKHVELQRHIQSYSVSDSNARDDTEIRNLVSSLTSSTTPKETSQEERDRLWNEFVNKK